MATLVLQLKVKETEKQEKSKSGYMPQGGKKGELGSKAGQPVQAGI